MKKNLIRIIAFSSLVLVLILAMTACKSNYKEYRGEYPELYSIAINSALGSAGYLRSEDMHQSVVEVIEEDSYGRKMFCYYEGGIFGAVSILVFQKSDEKFTYFYPDINFISAPLAKNNKVHFYDTVKPSKIDNPLNNFSEEQIQSLKDKNDWNKEIDETKCVKAEIVRKKKAGPLKYSQMKKLCEKLETNLSSFVLKDYVQFFIIDNYGRSIYVVFGKYKENIKDRFVTVLLFNPDGTYNEETCVMELADKFNYQNDLKAFKELNSWNEPFISQ